MLFEELVSSDRKDFVHKTYNKIIDNAGSIVNKTHNNNSIISIREACKVTFLSLVADNKELLEIEKEYCRETYIHEFELANATVKLAEPKVCKRCKSTKYSKRYCENCI